MPLNTPDLCLLVLTRPSCVELSSVSIQTQNNQLQVKKHLPSLYCDKSCSRSDLTQRNQPITAGCRPSLTAGLRRAGGGDGRRTRRERMKRRRRSRRRHLQQVLKSALFQPVFYIFNPRVLESTLNRDLRRLAAGL